LWANFFWYLADTCTVGAVGGYYTQCINPEDTSLKEVNIKYSDSGCTNAREYYLYPTGAKDSCRPFNGDGNYNKSYSVCYDRVNTELFGCYDESCGLNCDALSNGFYANCSYESNYTNQYFIQECLTMSDIVLNRENVHISYSDSCVAPTYTYDYFVYTNTCVPISPTQFTTYSCPSNSNNIMRTDCTNNLCTQDCNSFSISTNICTNGATYYCQSVTTTTTSGSSTSTTSGSSTSTTSGSSTSTTSGSSTTTSGSSTTTSGSSTTTTSGSSTVTTKFPIIMTGGNITTSNGNIIVVNIILIFALMVFVF